MILPLPVTLAEVYNGATKKVTYTRRVMQSDATTAEKSETIHIRIAPGWADCTVVAFPGMGDEAHDCEPADVGVEMQTESDPLWRRDGTKLVYTATITLSEALCGTIVEVPTFDGRLLSVPVTQIVGPGVTKTVAGEGMPFLDEPTRRGDLVIQFKTQFPETLTPAQKAAIKKALQ